MEDWACKKIISVKQKKPLSDMKDTSLASLQCDHEIKKAIRCVKHCKLNITET